MAPLLLGIAEKCHLKVLESSVRRTVGRLILTKETSTLSEPCGAVEQKNHDSTCQLSDRKAKSSRLTTQKYFWLSGKSRGR